MWNDCIYSHWKCECLMHGRILSMYTKTRVGHSTIILMSDLQNQWFYKP